MTNIYNINDFRTFLNRELKEYEASIGRMTKDERKDLRAWVADDNSVRSNPFYEKDEYGRPMDYISALRKCERAYKKELRKELKDYERTATDLTDEERKDLREWVTGGNSVYYNPYEMCDDNGRHLDYIEAVRTAEYLRENPENCRTECEPIVYADDDGIPF